MTLLRKIARRPVSILPDTLGHLHPILQRIYAGRQVQSATELDYDLRHLLHFKDLYGIDQAVSLLAKALVQQRRILIVGDFDADGATSTALAVSALRKMGATYVDYLIPNRFDYGYGLSPEIVAVAIQRQAELLVTVDNGIASYEGVVAAQTAGIQVIITDHHLLPERLPPAEAIVNPQQPEDRFASKYLAGVGVIFYVMLALRHYLQKEGWFELNKIARPSMTPFLDLVALGTVADMVPLDHNNRILVQQGLQRIRAGQARPGIQALARVANCNTSAVVASDLGFLIAPRLNAAGRLSDMSLGVSCLLADFEVEALPLAQALDQLNRARRLIEQEMQTQAFAILDQLQLPGTIQAGICLFDPRWHQGVIGLISGRIKERLQRPTIVFALGDQDVTLKGSARSIAGLHIRDILATVDTRHPGLIHRFGGHAMAAGLSLARAQYERFVTAFDQAVRQAMANSAWQNTLQTDGELSHTDFNVSLAELLQSASPWGQGFPAPLFEGCFQLLDQQLVAQRHLRMTLSLPGLTRPLKAIMFNIDLNQWPNHRVQQIKAVYRLNSETWQGRKSIQLIVEHLLSEN